MKESTLIKILRSVTENNCLPSEYEPLIPMLLEELIIYEAVRNNGLINVELGKAHAVYYEKYKRMNCGPFWSRLFYAFIFNIFEREDIERLERSAKKIEKAREKIMLAKPP